MDNYTNFFPAISARHYPAYSCNFENILTKIGRMAANAAAGELEDIGEAMDRQGRARVESSKAIYRAPLYKLATRVLLGKDVADKMKSLHLQQTKLGAHGWVMSQRADRLDKEISDLSNKKSLTDAEKSTLARKQSQLERTRDKLDLLEKTHKHLENETLTKPMGEKFGGKLRLWAYKNFLDPEMRMRGYGYGASRAHDNTNTVSRHLEDIKTERMLPEELKEKLYEARGLQRSLQYGGGDSMTTRVLGKVIDSLIEAPRSIVRPALESSIYKRVRRWLDKATLSPDKTSKARKLTTPYDINRDDIKTADSELREFYKRNPSLHPGYQENAKIFSRPCHFSRRVIYVGTLYKHHSC